MSDMGPCTKKLYYGTFSEMKSYLVASGTTYTQEPKTENDFID